MQFGVQFFPAVDHTDKSAADYYAFRYKFAPR